MQKNPYGSISAQESGHPGNRIKEAKQALEWTQQTIKLLSQLLHTLSKPIKAWESFCSLNGDINYFSDIDLFSGRPKLSQRRKLALGAISEIFETLQGFEQTLLVLEKSCSKSADLVGHKTSSSTQHFFRTSKVIDSCS